MRQRILPIAITSVLLLAACSGSDNAADNVPTSTIAAPVTTAPAVSTEDSPSTTLSATTDPLGTDQVLADLVTQAGADGNVTGEELSAILVAAGVPVAQADCQGRLLADLGLTDPTDVDSLQAATAKLSDAERLDLSTALSACMGTSPG